DKLSPKSNVLASPLPRIIAAVIDWITVILFMLPVRVLANTEFVESSSFFKTILFLADFIPILVYTTVLFFWKQSVGRNLMQLRILNRFGMIPKGRKMVFRSLLRMVFPWAMAMLTLASIGGSGWLDRAGLFVLGSITLFLVINAAGMFVSRKHRCLHDVIFETQAVIDS
ncbi:MAG: RDD family protein, partial [Planctomycetota bacterium]